VLDRGALATLGERLLRTGERLPEHYDHEVVDEVRLRPRRTLAVVLGLQALHERRRAGDRPHGERVPVGDRHRQRRVVEMFLLAEERTDMTGFEEA